MVGGGCGSVETASLVRGVQLRAAESIIMLYFVCLTQHDDMSFTAGTRERLKVSVLALSLSCQ